MSSSSLNACRAEVREIIDRYQPHFFRSPATSLIANPEDSAADESNLMEDEISELDETVKAPVSTFDQQIKPTTIKKQLSSEKTNEEKLAKVKLGGKIVNIEEVKEKQQ